MACLESLEVGVGFWKNEKKGRAFARSGACAESGGNSGVNQDPLKPRRRGGSIYRTWFWFCGESPKVCTGWSRGYILHFVEIKNSICHNRAL